MDNNERFSFEPDDKGTPEDFQLNLSPEEQMKFFLLGLYHFNKKRIDKLSYSKQRLELLIKAYANDQQCFDRLGHLADQLRIVGEKLVQSKTLVDDLELQLMEMELLD